MDSLNSVQDDINWAKSRIDEGKVLFETCLNDDPFSFLIETDPHTGEHFHKFKLVKDFPIEIKHLFRNALVDLKHSFDRALNAAAQEVRGRTYNSSYPWADSVVGFKSILRKRQTDVKTALPFNLLRELFRQYPYAGSPKAPEGQDLIREIAHMANAKHTVGFEIRASASLAVISNGHFSNTWPVFDGWDAVKKELVIARSAPNGKAVHGNTELSTHIFFERSGELGKLPAWIALWHFADHAEACLQGFRRVCDR